MKKIKKYKCSGCHRIIERCSDKQWIPTTCDQIKNRTARLYLLGIIKG